MAVFNYAGGEINAKVVYYGPALSGKTTNIEYLYAKMPANAKGKLVSMKTRSDRTLFFDFLPLDIGEINDFKIRILLYTVPGQVYYNATRKLVLKGADAVVFVADSSAAKMDENIESLRNLEENLNEHDLTLDTIPWVIQYNKRDVSDAMSVEDLSARLNPLGVPNYEGVATRGDGVFSTFEAVARMLYQDLGERLRKSAPPPAPRSVQEPTSGGMPSATDIPTPPPPAVPPPASNARPAKEATVVGETSHGAASETASSGNEGAFSESIDETPISDVLDAALREVDDIEQAMPGQHDEQEEKLKVTPSHVAADDVSYSLADSEADHDDGDRDGEDVGAESFQFESLEEGPIDDAVGRVLDLEDTARVTGVPPAEGEFIIDPFQSSPKPKKKESDSAKPAKSAKPATPPKPSKPAPRVKTPNEERDPSAPPERMTTTTASSPKPEANPVAETAQEQSPQRKAEWSPHDSTPEAERTPVGVATERPNSTPVEPPRPAKPAPRSVKPALRPAKPAPRPAGPAARPAKSAPRPAEAAPSPTEHTAPLRSKSSTPLATADAIEVTVPVVVTRSELGKVPIKLVLEIEVVDD
jgi:signal recognition particle receptor subunit beta